MIVEVLVSAALILGPPIADGPAEGPVPSDEIAAEPEAEPAPEAGDDETARIVAEATIAAQDRAVLERNNEEVPEFVRQLDALATVDAALDTCGKAVQAELRMDLALAYLRVAGTCSEGEAEADPDPNAPAPELEYPRECEAASTPSDCAALLLERAAEFGDSGPAGAEDPLAQAAGCPHAVESMTVERMFGSCVATEYADAVERWRASQAPVETERKSLDLNVPRWASITGIAVGAGAIAAGAALVAIDGKCPGGGEPTDVDACPDVYNTDVGGAVLISVGALAVLGMGTILTITEIQRKKGKGKANATLMRRRMQRVAAITGWQAPRLQLRSPRRP